MALLLWWTLSVLWSFLLLALVVWILLTLKPARYLVLEMCFQQVLQWFSLFAIQWYFRVVVLEWFLEWALQGFFLAWVRREHWDLCTDRLGKIRPFHICFHIDHSDWDCFSS